VLKTELWERTQTLAITGNYTIMLKCFARDTVACQQERNEVRWRPGQEASLAPPCSNLGSFGTKCTVLKKVLVTLLGLIGALAVIWRPHSDSASGEVYPPCPSVVTPLLASCHLFMYATSGATHRKIKPAVHANLLINHRNTNNAIFSAKISDAILECGRRICERFDKSDFRFNSSHEPQKNIPYSVRQSNR